MHGPSLLDCDTVFFKAQFLAYPPHPFQVVWPQPNARHLLTGTLVKHTQIGRVWRLTGRFDPTHKGFEATWPD